MVSGHVKLRGVLLETDRLQLRPLTTGDIEALMAMQTHPEVERYFGPQDRQEVTAWVELINADWATYGYSRLGVVERATRRLVGRSGLKRWEEFEETEVGWVLHPDSWGRGYATEAGRACLDWGFRIQAIHYITAMIRPTNARSIAVAERLGMEPLRNDILLGGPVIVYAITRETWTARAVDERKPQKEPPDVRALH